MASSSTPATAGSAAPSDQPKIVLYWLEQSRSQRILWLLEALSVPYTLEIFHRNPKTRLAPPELKKIHPLGKSPVMSVTAPGEGGKTVVIAESANIVEYLLEHFGQGTTLLPKRWEEGKEGQIAGETEEWLRYRYFMHYAEGSLMTLMLVSIVASSIRSSPVPFFLKPVTGMISSKITDSFLTPSFTTHFGFLESQLASSPNGGAYLCGPNITGADILMSFPIIAAQGRVGLTAEKYPKLAAYAAALEKDKNYIRAADKIIEIDGKFEATFKL